MWTWSSAPRFSSHGISQARVSTVVSHHDSSFLHANMAAWKSLQGSLANVTKNLQSVDLSGVGSSMSGAGERFTVSLCPIQCVSKLIGGGWNDRTPSVLLHSNSRRARAGLKRLISQNYQKVRSSLLSAGHRLQSTPREQTILLWNARLML